MNRTISVIVIAVLYLLTCVTVTLAETTVAVLAENPLTTTSSADPEIIGEWLTKNGYIAEPLTLNQVIDARILTRERYDILVLPDSPHYPAAGKDALIQYLKQGGCVFAIGGYAFDKPIVHDDNGWHETDAQDVRINTRFGKPGDFARILPEQIGLFDPGYRLEHVHHATCSPNQYVISTDWNIDLPLTGYAATALTGNNKPVFADVYARWIPLLNAYDQYNRLRGAAGAIVHHYDGPYANSSWAAIGATNHDLFNTPESEAPFIDIIRALADRTFLHEIQTNWPYYEPDETVTVTAHITNGSDQDCSFDLRFNIDDTPFHNATITCPANTTQPITATLENIPHALRTDFHRVSIHVRKDDRDIDAIETAFVVHNDTVIGNGPKIALRDNYFEIDGKSQFLTGTNHTGMMWYCKSENPLTWEHEFAKMRDSGFRLLRVLHFSSFATGAYEGKQTNKPLDLKNPPERLIRQTDALIQMAQKHGIVFWLVLHDWMRVDLTDEELAAQSAWNKFWTRRYKDVPGVMYDLQNEPWIQIDKKHGDTWERYNTWLQDKYTTIERLRKTWRLADDDDRDFGEFTPVHVKPIPWNDVRERDIILFKRHLLDRWAKVNAEGIRAGDPDALFTIGYLSNMGPADKILGVEHTSFSNMHAYGPVHEIPLEFKLIDRRVVGKTFSIGEFGAIHSHHQRTTGQDVYDYPDAVQRYVLMAHYALGLGASFIADWVWKDFNECIFPWGLLHSQDGVRKDHLLAYRNVGLFFKLLQPKYESPRVWLLVPDSHRIGSRFGPVHNMLHNTVGGLLEIGIPFGVINEWDLDKLPTDAQAIIYPLAYCPNDKTFEQLLAVAQNGTDIYISGDIAYDEDRNRTRMARYELMGLADPGQTSPLTESSWDNALIEHSARGWHLYHPIEASTVSPGKVYHDFLLSHTDVKDQPDINRVMSAPDGAYKMWLPARDGGDIQVLIVPDAQTIEGPFVSSSVAFEAKGMGCALISRDAEQRVRAIESHGRITIKDQLQIDSEGQFMLASLYKNDITSSTKLLFVPLADGEWTMSRNVRWNEPVIEYGDIVDGQWRQLERISLAHNEKTIKLNVTKEQRLNLAIIAEAQEIDAAISDVIALHAR